MIPSRENLSLGTMSSNVYGTSNFHKPLSKNCPNFRSTLSDISTPTFKLAQFLVSI